MDVVTWVNTNTKTHQTEHLWSMHFIKCKLYLNLKTFFSIYTSKTDFENEKFSILGGSKNMKHTGKILKRDVMNPDKEILQNGIK